MPYLFTSESVSEGHPDKVADQISDALIDNFLAFDPQSKVACETLVTTGQVVLAGEVRSKAYLDVQEIARGVIKKIGYTKSEYMFEANSCGVLSAIHEQSSDINQGVDRKKKEEQGAGDQGMMFGYATNETEHYMPLALDLAHNLLIELAAIRREKNSKMPYLRPDAKSQVTLEYDDNNQPVRIDAIVISTQHDDFADEPTMLAKIKKDIINILIPRVKAKYPKYAHLFNNKIKYISLLGKDLALRDLASLINHFPELHSSFIHRFLMEAYLFLSNPHFIHTVHIRLREHLHGTKPNIVIAHSIGSVIAYNYLIQHPSHI